MSVSCFLGNGHYWHCPAGTGDTNGWALTWDQYFALDSNLMFSPSLSLQSDLPAQAMYEADIWKLNCSSQIFPYLEDPFALFYRVICLPSANPKEKASDQLHGMTKGKGSMCFLNFLSLSQEWQAGHIALGVLVTECLWTKILKPIFGQPCCGPLKNC